MRRAKRTDERDKKNSAISLLQISQEGKIRPVKSNIFLRADASAYDF